MSIIQIDGFKVYLNLDGSRSIIIDSDHIVECMRIYAKNNLDGVAITTSHGYKLPHIDFIYNYTDIKHLSISDGIPDINPIHLLRGLESLIISGKNRKVDFSSFPCLKKLIADWSPHLLNIDQCVYLENLSLYNFSPKSNDCLSISNLTWIKRLEIVQSTITSLNGLEKLDQLREIAFNYCSKLANLCCLENSKETLVSLLFNYCKAIKNHEYVNTLKNLKILAFNNCGVISSIKFIEEMRALKSFRFMNTDIADGDMLTCLGLEYVAFSNKKHFSHTREDIDILLKG